jgi:hypothetical protein
MRVHHNFVGGWVVNWVFMQCVYVWKKEGSACECEGMWYFYVNACVCVYVCMWMCVCMHVCVCVYLCVCARMCLFECDNLDWTVMDKGYIVCWWWPEYKVYGFEAFHTFTVSVFNFYVLFFYNKCFFVQYKLN